MKTKTTRPERLLGTSPTTSNTSCRLTARGREWCSCSAWRTARPTVDLSRAHHSVSVHDRVHREQVRRRDYRAKILGDWDSERRCEQYFERVSFAIDGCFRVTDETLARTRSQQQK